ncbi:Transmembrane protein 237 [Anthophora retusa]
MSQSKERISRRWSTAEVSRRKRDSSSTEETSSSIYSTEHSIHVKNTSTPLRVRRSDLKEINRSRRSRGKIQDIEEEVSSDEKGSKRSRRHKERVGQEKHQRERIIQMQTEGRHSRRVKRRRDRRSKESEEQKQDETSSSESSEENYDDGDVERSKRKKRNVREKDELPITEILKKSQENKRTRYESQDPYPTLSTDKIYVQHRDGFSAMKINKTKDLRGESNAEIGESVAGESSPPIRVAIMVQEFLKNIGLVCQGFLGGMALMHFIMARLYSIHVFFNASTEFIARYSVISEIYTSIFSFLVIMCIISIFDKFDLARFDVEHLRELYFDYNRAVIAVPLYLVVFCLHQACARTDNQLNMIHYISSNDSTRENVTETLFDDLNSWQKISMSKDLLAVLAWLFVSFGAKDDAFLMYLQSMEKYATDVESSR